jgi:bifunctional DNA-binding transcriptional regulator/antitoxin component of YhaV-PrlF toxin-antitoxin module
MANDYDTSRAQYESYRYAYDNGHSDWVIRAARCFDYWNGKQWDKLIKARLDHEGRPTLTLNIIESLVRALEGMQRALRNDVRFAPVADANGETAKVQDALWLHVQQQNQLDFLETDVYKKGLIMDRAYYDVRVSYGDSLQGHAKITSPRSQDIILDPSIETYDTEAWPQVFKRRWVSYDDIFNLYGKEQAEAIGFSAMPSWYDYEDQFMSQQMGALPYYARTLMTDLRAVRGHLLLERQYTAMKRKEFFVDMQTGDMSEIPETWDRDRTAHVLEATPGLGTMWRMAKTVRWTVTCENQVLHDEDSPYKRFTIIPFFPNFVDGIAMGAVGSLLDPQDLYNKMTSQELHIINTTANSGLIVKRGSVKNMTIEEMEQFGSRSGIVLEVDNVEDVKKITPNSTPQGHDRLSFKADQIMRSIAGVSNQARGFAREDVAGEAIMANQAAQDINSAGWLSNLHRTKQMLASSTQDVWQAHYTDTRVIMINRGSVYKPEIQELTLNQVTAEGEVVNDVTHGKYTTTLVPSPARSTMSEGDFKVLLQMREKLGIAIPDSLLIELSPASNKGQIIESLQGDSNERQRAAEESQAQQQAIEQQKTTAQARKEEAAAMLNQARAEKAATEAQIDPDASYERVETDRIDAQRDAHRDKMKLEWAKLDRDEQNKSQDVALRLTEMDHSRDTAVEAARQKSAESRDKKPTSKPGKNK